MASPEEILTNALWHVLPEHPPTRPEGDLLLPLAFVQQLLHGFQPALATAPLLYEPWVLGTPESTAAASAASCETAAKASHDAEDLMQESAEHSTIPVHELSSATVIAPEHDTATAPSPLRLCAHVPYVMTLARNLVNLKHPTVAIEGTDERSTVADSSQDVLHLPSMATIIFEESLEERQFLRAALPAINDDVETIIQLASEHGFTSPKLIVPVQRVLDLVGGYRGIQALLGLRLTVGSVPALPPPTYMLERAFHALHADTKGDKPMKHKSILTVGARAYLKHCHRGADAWWGVDVGSEKEKNERATALLHKLLRDAIWTNVHMLPGDEWVVEIRVAEGYGARWTADGHKFRGFLEPPMPDGHIKGWRH